VVGAQDLADGERRAVEPDPGDGLPEIENRPARRRSDDEGQRGVTARGAGRPVEGQARLDGRDVDRDRRVPVDHHRRRRQVEVRRHG